MTSNLFFFFFLHLRTGQGLGLLTNFNNDIVLTFSISGMTIPPGVGEVLIISTTSTCLAAEICFVNGVFSGARLVQIST